MTWSSRTERLFEMKKKRGVGTGQPDGAKRIPARGRGSFGTGATVFGRQKNTGKKRTKYESN